MHKFYYSEKQKQFFLAGCFMRPLDNLTSFIEIDGSTHEFTECCEIDKAPKFDDAVYLGEADNNNILYLVPYIVPAMKQLLDARSAGQWWKKN